VSRLALMRAIELNGVQVDNNKAAFEWGRRCAHDLAAVQALFKAQQVIQFVKKPSLAEVIAKRVEFLTAYQNSAYAQDYQALVERVRAAEAPLGKTALSEAVARSLFKLMAYKDEYEVARLHTQTGFAEKIGAMFEGDYKLVHHLAPPLLAKKNDKGELVKRPFGPWIRPAFGLLARLKGLRGTPFDFFGLTEERRTERALIAEYRATVEQLIARLDAGNHALALEIARLPEQIKGYGHVKARNLAKVRPQWTGLMQQWSAARAEQLQAA
jgi:indolepyruvate ferredoxin oxidoreductase